MAIPINQLIELGEQTARFNREILLPALNGQRDLPGCREPGPAEGPYEVWLLLADGPIVRSGVLSGARPWFLEPLVGEVARLLEPGGVGFATLYGDHAREVTSVLAGVRVVKRDDGPIPLRPLEATVPTRARYSSGHGAYGHHYDPASGACAAIINALRPGDAANRLGSAAPNALTVEFGDVGVEDSSDGRRVRTRRPFRVHGEVEVSATYSEDLPLTGSRMWARYFIVAQGELVRDSGELVPPIDIPGPDSAWVELYAKTSESAGGVRGVPTLRRVEHPVSDAVSYQLSAKQQADVVRNMRLPEAAERGPNTLTVQVPSRAGLPRV